MSNVVTEFGLSIPKDTRDIQGSFSRPRDDLVAPWPIRSVVAAVHGSGSSVSPRSMERPGKFSAYWDVPLSAGTIQFKPRDLYHLVEHT